MQVGVVSFLLGAIMMMASVASSATTLLAKNFHDIVDESDAVVAGTVTGIQSVRAPSGDIYSFVRLESLELIDGEYTEPAFTFQIYGGRVDDEMQAAQGAPEFVSGERVILFVKQNGSWLVPFVGWNQDVFRVVKDKSGKSRVLDGWGAPVIAVQGANIVRGIPAERAASGVAMMGSAGIIVDASGQRPALQTKPSQAPFGPGMEVSEFVALAKARVQRTNKKKQFFRSSRPEDLASQRGITLEALQE